MQKNQCSGVSDAGGAGGKIEREGVSAREPFLHRFDDFGPGDVHERGAVEGGVEGGRGGVHAGAEMGGERVEEDVAGAVAGCSVGGGIADGGDVEEALGWVGRSHGCGSCC